MSELGGQLVVDASVAIAMIRSEPASTKLRLLLVGSNVVGHRILVPDGFWIELSNVLMRRYAMTPEEVVGAIREIDELRVESVRIDRALLLAVHYGRDPIDWVRFGLHLAQLRAEAVAEAR